MNPLRAFLKGLFTRHLGTKFLSLILSVVLFAFVLQSISGKREIRHLVFNLHLSKELQDKYVLMTPNARVELDNLEIQGVRAKVDPIAKKLELNPTIDLGVDAALVRQYAEPDGSKPIQIPVDKAFFRKQRILEEGVDLVAEPHPVQSISLDPKVELDLQVGLADNASLKLPPQSSWRPPKGDLVPVQFDPPVVKLTGPKTYLVPSGNKPDALYVRIPSIESSLENAPAQRTYSVQEVLWKQSGIDQRGLPFVRILQPADAAPQDLASSLSFTFEVADALQTLELSIPWVIKFPAGETMSAAEFHKKYLCMGSQNFRSFGEVDMAPGKALHLSVKAPKSDKEDELNSSLVLVLDFTNRKVSDDKKEVLVPVHLDVQDNLKPQQRALLSRLQLETDTTPGPETDTQGPFVRFTLR